MRERVPNYCHVWIAPHGVDIEYFQPTSAWENKSNIIIFCGSMNVTMNVDAALRSAQKIFPIVRNAVPDAEFWIVGRNPDRRVLKIAGLEGITVTGTVEDVKPYYEKAKVAVAPFRYGGGIKVKILEAMAMGVPVVSTDVSCFGLEVTPGKHILTANDDEAFAKQVVLLLKDSSLWKKLSDEGRLLVKQKYVWRSIVEEVVAHLENLVAEKRIGGI
jgi:glycosyltransferase involved in cell wall biosynthesis